MPVFAITGKGIKTGRKRSRRYPAIDEPAARAMAASDETEILTIVMESLPQASDELIEIARGMNAEVEATSSHLDCLKAMFDRAIKARLPMQITYGIAWNEEMDEVPWRAIIRPSSYRRSPQGLRISGNVEPIGNYSITGDNQREGARQYLLEEIDHATPHIKEI